MSVILTKYKQPPFRRLQDVQTTGRHSIKIGKTPYTIYEIENTGSTHKYGIRLVNEKTGQNMIVMGDYEATRNLSTALRDPRTAKSLIDKTVIKGDISKEIAPVLFLSSFDGKTYTPPPLSFSEPDKAEKLYDTQAMREPEIPLTRQERNALENARALASVAPANEARSRAGGANVGLMAGHGSLVTNPPADSQDPQQTGMASGAGQEASTSGNYRS